LTTFAAQADRVRSGEDGGVVVLAALQLLGSVVGLPVDVEDELLTAPPPPHPDMEAARTPIAAEIADRRLILVLKSISEHCSF
jgi:hypothetical protein